MRSWLGLVFGIVALLLLLMQTPLFTLARIDLTIEEHLLDEAPHECRFWGMVGSSLPETVVTNHLVYGSSSLKALGLYNYNGWGLAYYNSSRPTVLRGALPANSDPVYDSAVSELAQSSSHVGVGHVRLATSGAVDIPDPHPFVRLKGGKWWAFGHNGGLSEQTLKELIGQEYLDQNLPTIGDNWSDPRVVDSDLYMLYILRCIGESEWNVTVGIGKAVRDITRNMYGTLNFFLTDGETLWSFRLGNTLYYYCATGAQYSAVASQPPTADFEGWNAMQEFNLVILIADKPPVIVDDVRAVLEPLARALEDVNGDSHIDMRDVALVSEAFGSYPSHPRWNIRADLNEDGVVNLKDVGRIVSNFGRMIH